MRNKEDPMDPKTQINSPILKSGHESAPVLLPGFAIIWQQNQVTRQVQLCDFTQILFWIHYLKLSIQCSMRNNVWRNEIEIWS